MNFVAATSRPSPYLRFNVGLKITVIPRRRSNDAELTFDNRLLDRDVAESKRFCSQRWLY